MRACLHPCLARLAVIGLILAVVVAGFNMRPVPSEMALRLEVWAMAGLPVDDLCADHGTTRDHDGHCPLCTLTGVAGLPPVMAFAVDAEQRILARIVLPQIRRAAGHARDPAVPKRGPPVLI
ncbi:DUF2946 family protein [uncultured Paracoccus sp.]|uniref:DUF2946 family protein n=1 Tax=uncultured Paracoccus sp. TaxID=189685 RepID=UPI0025E47802|nr:DUF2946 family protein [uncultured Paracoccus sp.]